MKRLFTCFEGEEQFLLVFSYLPKSFRFVLQGMCKVGSTGAGDINSKVYKEETILKLYKSARGYINNLKYTRYFFYMNFMNLVQVVWKRKLSIIFSKHCSFHRRQLVNGNIARKITFGLTVV